MSDESTRPADIEGIGASAALWQLETSAWSFGPTHERVISSAALPIDSGSARGLANESTDSTLGPQRIVAPPLTSIRLRRIDFGRRSLQAVSHWEGVVEEVTNIGFRARLVPLTNADPSSARIEFTDFTLDDLANDSDRALVHEGAVFYWTVGRSQNAAGTRTNVSLVRFRRLPPPGPYQRHQALVEAEKLLRDLGGSDRTVGPSV
jgi:hypothetical protein